MAPASRAVLKLLVGASSTSHRHFAHALDGVAAAAAGRTRTGTRAVPKDVPIFLPPLAPVWPAPDG